MATKYENGENVLMDILLAAISLKDRLSDRETNEFIFNNVEKAVLYEVENKKDIKYLNFEIIFDNFGDCLEVKANNIVTALWFINEWPYDPEYIMKAKKYLTDTGYYRFDGRTKKLIFYEKT
jgi:hypothetical protein